MIGKNGYRGIRLTAALTLGAAVVSLVGYLYSDFDQTLWQWRAIYLYETTEDKRDGNLSPVQSRDGGSGETVHPLFRQVASPVPQVYEADAERPVRAADQAGHPNPD